MQPLFQRFPNRATLATTLALLALPLALPSVTLASEIVVLATGALSCALLLGSVGLLSFGQGLFFGIGAYSMGLLLRDVGVGFAGATAAAIVIGALAAGPIGWLIVRRRGVYFVMLTFAFAQMGFFAMHAMGKLTGGENGLDDVPRISFSSTGAINALAAYALLAVLFFAAFLVVQRLQASPFGTVLAAIRSNEGRAEALGYDTSRYKLTAFVVAASIAALAGAMNTIFLGFVPPSAIDLEISERLLIVALIGGAGSPAGALLGAGFYAVLADLIGHVWPRWLILIAILLIVVVLFLKGGLVSAAGQVRSYILGRRGHENAA